MSTIDRDRLVRVSRELEVVFILILVGSVAQELEGVNSFGAAPNFCIQASWLDPSDASLYAAAHGSRECPPDFAF
jgi:hypothetical protein